MRLLHHPRWSGALMLSAKPSLLRQLLLCVIRVLHSKLRKSSLNASVDLRDAENCRFVVT